MLSAHLDACNTYYIYTQRVYLYYARVSVFACVCSVIANLLVMTSRIWFEMV